MRIALCALDISWEDVGENFLKIKKVLKNLNDQDLVVFPELSIFGFSMNRTKILENSEKLKEVDEWVSRWHAKNSVDVIYGTPLILGNDVFNSAVLYSRGQRKVHNKSKLFSHAGEDNYYAKSPNSLTSANDLLLSICFELRFPELFSNKRLDFNIAVNIANWPESRIDHYTSLSMARAIENQAFMVCVNRSGTGDGIDYNNGYASIFDYAGNVLTPEKNLFIHGPISLYKIELDGLNDFRNKFRFYE